MSIEVPHVRPDRAEDHVVRPRTQLVGLLAMAVLLVAVPVLAFVGARKVLDSRDGKFIRTSTSPSSPGYRAIVEPTATAMLVQRTAEGAVDSVTVLALGAGDAGGTVLTIPLGTHLKVPIGQLVTLGQVAAQTEVEVLAGQVSTLLGARIDTVVEVDPSGMAALVEPVSPLGVDNPDPVVVGSEVVEPGDVQLDAAEVGPYLEARGPDESDLNRLARHEALWEGWLASLKVRGPAESVPAGSALAPFLTTLAAGDPVVETLDVEPVGSAAGEEFVATDATAAQVVDAIPFPTAPAPGARWTAHLLNGWRGEEVPPELARVLVEHGGQVEQVGNAETLGNVGTTVLVADETKRGLADILAKVLGGAEVRVDPRLAGTVDIVVVAGRDLLQDVGG